MDMKRRALFFIFLVCSGHVGSAYGGGGGNQVTTEGCEIKAELILIIDKCIEKVALKLQDEKQVKDVVIKNFKASDCRCKNLHQIKRTACSCICYRDFIRIFVHCSIFNVLLSFVLSLTAKLGALRGLLNVVVGVLKKVVNLLVQILCLKIDVIIVIDGHFDGGRCLVKDILPPKIGKIEILNIKISGLNDALGGLVGSILSAVINILLPNDFLLAVKAAFEQLILQRGWYRCDTPPPVIHPPPAKPPCVCP